MATPTRISPDQRNAALGFLVCTLRQAGYEQLKAPLNAPLRPARPPKDNGDSYTCVSGGSVYQCAAIESLLGEWFGTPAITENRMGDYLIGRSARLPNGIQLNFLAERDGGISLYIPKSTCPALVEKLAQRIEAANTPSAPSR